MDTSKKHFDALHGLRGVAALLVVIGHLNYFVGFDLVPSNHFAVDLFFVLSGFVIAHAYDDRFSKGLGLVQFAIARILRLYPLYILGIVISIFWVVISPILGLTPGYSRLSLLGSIASGLAFLPNPPSLSVNPELVFPLNGPAWSLFWELVINFAFAAVAVKMNQRALGLVIITGAIAVVAASWVRGGLGDGAYWDGAWVGIVRVWFSFAAGVYLRRHHLTAPSHRPLVYAGVMATAVATMMVPKFEWTWLYDALVVVFVFPTLILAASHISLNGMTRSASNVAGEVSYAVYALHMPLLDMFAKSWTGIMQASVTELPITVAVVIVAGIVLIAFVANYFFDLPIRKWLAHRRRRARASAA